MDVAGRVAVVTGASSGLGRVLARALAQDGAAVVGFARRFAGPGPASSSEPLAVRAGQVLECQLDVSDEAAVVAAFARLGRVDVLINNAGDAVFAPFERMRVADLRAMLDAHVVGAFVCAREALAKMKAQGAGHIVNVSSVAVFETFTGCAGYTAAKEGLRGLTRVLVEEARACNVRVTGLYPGAIDTPIWDDKGAVDRARMMRPEDVAALVLAVLAHPELSVEELKLRPPTGNV